LRTYLYFDDAFLRENYYWRLPTRLEIGILWYTRRTPSTIYAMATAIIQLCPHSSTAPLPDFQSLSPKQKEGIYQHVEEKLKPSLVNCTVNWQYNSGLSCNDRARAGCSALSNSCNPNPKTLCHDAVTWNHSRSCGQQCKLKLLTYIEA
jgi:hypothetical protein